MVSLILMTFIFYHMFYQTVTLKKYIFGTIAEVDFKETRVGVGVVWWWSGGGPGAADCVVGGGAEGLWLVQAAMSPATIAFTPLLTLH